MADVSALRSICSDRVVSIACLRKDGCPARAIQSESGIKISEKTILEIAPIHPRFAIALASLNKVGGLKGWTKFSAFPAPLTASEVANWLKPNEEVKSFFRDYAARRVVGADIIEIEFTLTNIDDTHARISGKIIHHFPEDPPQTQLDIEIDRGKVISWSVN